MRRDADHPPAARAAVRAYRLPGRWPVLTITTPGGDRAILAMEHLAPVDALRAAHRPARAAAAYEAEARKAFGDLNATVSLRRGPAPDPWALPDLSGAVLLDAYRPGV